MSTFTYFAYGSNMLTSRLTARCPSARVLGTAVAADHEVSFCLFSEIDHSGKAAIRAVPGRAAWGVLFEIALDERPVLDRAESAGTVYHRRDDFPVRFADGTDLPVTTYIPMVELGAHTPYDWYLALCLAGAEQNALPEETVSILRAHRAVVDPQPQRPGRLIALEALGAAGREDLPLQLAG